MTPLKKQLLLIAALGAASAQAQPREITGESVAEFFDAAYVTQNHAYSLVGLTVSVVHRSEVIFKKGYGFADLEKRVPVDPDRHLFRIASITKTFTATAVMQLVEQGQLDLEADVQSYLDFDIPKTYSEPIRLKHLLTHTAGFEDYNFGGVADELEQIVPLREFLIEHMPERVNRPGAFHSYSNYGSALAGYIVAQTSGMPWADYVKAKLLDPLGMTQTNAHQPRTDGHRQNHAISYSQSGDTFEAQPFHFFADAPNGVMSTTAADMTRWMFVHLNHGELNGVRILGEETSRQMQTELFRQHPQSNAMLHGLFQERKNGQSLVTHGGSFGKFFSQFVLIPGQQLGLFIAYNADTGRAANQEMIPAFMDHFFPVDFPEPITPDASVDLGDYVGTYAGLRRNRSTFEKLILLMGGVDVRPAGEGVLSLSGAHWIALEKDVFQKMDSPRKLYAQRGDNGEVTHLIFSEGYSAERLAWHEDPALHRALFLLVAVASLLGAIGFVRKLFSRKTDGKPLLPALDRWAVGLACLFTLFVLYRIGSELNAPTGGFVHGVPPAVKLLLAWILLTVPLALAIGGLAVRQWRRSHGTVMARIRYSFMALINALFVVLLWHWNLLSYYFS
jgi:CubicO group peptidase (beta-lactamase class C family)